jgi:hypothetical protein
MNWAGIMHLTRDNDASQHHKVFLMALAGLLILRIPFEGFLSMFYIKWESWHWVEPVYQIGTYLLITFLIWWELDHLADYHIDTMAIIAIVLFVPIQTLILKFWGFDHNPLRFPHISSLVIWLIAIVFLIALVKNWRRLPKVRASSFVWIGIGLLAGIGTSVLLSYPNSFLYPADEYFMGPRMLFSTFTLRDIGVKFVYQMGYAAALEEPVFRGFLWGYLLKLGWNDRRIWIFQTVLFTLGHMSGLRWYPLQFFVTVPIVTLILGYLVWRSRTITSSLAAHGMNNAVSDLTAGLVAQYLR